MEPLIISISGVRGIIGEALVPQVATEFGLAFGSYLRQNHTYQTRPKVTIGRDSRPSGNMMVSAMAAGLMAAGCDVVDLGIVTTPGGALMVKHLKCQGGVVITASHNPVQYNGIKLIRNDAIGFPADEIKQIQARYFDKKFDYVDSVNTGRFSSDSTTHAAHVDTVLQICDKTLIASKRFKVVLDSINGAGCVVTPMLLSSLGCELIHLNERPTGIFAHTPEPTAENLTQLGPEIVKHSADIGFAQDPDADRLAIVDEKGNYIGEEFSVALAVKYMLSHKKGPIAVNLSTSRMVDDLARQAGCRVIRTPVGEANVANAMLAENCIIGGEGNGGVIDLRVVPIRNSLVGIALTLQLMAQTGKTVSELVSEIPHYHMKKTKMPCSKEKVPEVLARVQQYYADSKNSAHSNSAVKIDTQDGIRIDMPEGWVQLRGSNTEPIVRIIAESSDARQTDKLIEQIGRIAGLIS